MRADSGTGRALSSARARTLAVGEASAAAAGSTAFPLVATKLYVPRRRGDLVERPSLIHRMDEGGGRKLTLVSAPAGFGKTTLLAEWLGTLGADRPVAWVSLDPSDDDPAAFWAYVVAALRRAHPALARSLAWMPSAGPPATALVTTLINQVGAAEVDVVLTLDDYHVVGNAAIHDAMGFLLDRLPARMRVVIATRSDPPLALARLRARGELAEVRVSDLRFTTEEASAFLVHLMGLPLSAGDVAKLEVRTEGWVAALKLAALSLKGRQDTTAAVDAFSGDSRFVADYLVDEVLRAQPDPIRRFLLATAVLDRMSGPLCDAVTGRTDCARLLEDLERSNLFVVALDDRREWYRYHHLFADVLRSRSLREDPAEVPNAHRRASAWYEAAGERADAVRHAIEAGDLDRAAALLEAVWPANDRSHASGRWLALARTLPEAVIRARPSLAMAYAWALLNRGDLEPAEAWLRELEAEPARGAELPSLPREIASARAYLAQSRGDTSATVRYARRALELTPPQEAAARATGTALLALACWADGQLDAAHDTFAEALEHMRAAGAMLDVVRGTFVLGDLRVVQGRLQEARAIYQGGLDLAAAQIRPGAAPETDELLLGLAELHTEWNDLDAARGLLARIADRTGGEHRGNRERWCTATAGVLAAAGDPQGALASLEEAKGLSWRNPIPRHRPLDAMEARVLIRLGKVAEVTRWAEERRVSTGAEVSFLGEYDLVTLARLQLARREGSDLADACALLDRLAASAEAGGRGGSLVEVLVLRALADQAAGDVRRALAPLGRALALAHAEGRVRVFLDEGDPLRELLRHAIARGIEPAATQRVLAAFAPGTPVGEGAPAPSEPGGSLTPKEMRVLRLIAEGLRNQQIADHLFISPATVKRHVANLYAKLGVGHRTEALVRAKELGLL